MIARDHPIAPFLRYMGGAALSFGIILSITGGLTAVQVKPNIAYCTALAVAFCVNYFVNRLWIFSAAEGCPRRQARRFVVASLVTRGCEWLAFVALNAAFGWHAMVTATMVQGVSALLKYFLFKHAVFTTAR